MDIFSNKQLTTDNMDYTHWQTLNGDYLDVEKARSEYLESWSETLEYYMDRYPSHANYPVWSRYLDAFRDELDERE